MVISQKDIKIIVLGVLIGRILQIVSYKYLKNKYAELLTAKNSYKIYYVCGGPLVEVSVSGIQLILILAKKGVWIEFTTAALRINWNKVLIISLNKFVEHLGRLLPLAYSNYEINYDKKFIIIDGEKI